MEATTTKRNRYTKTCQRCLEPIRPGEKTTYNRSGNCVTHATPCRMRTISEMTEEELEDMTAAEAFKRGAEYWVGR